MTNKTTTEQRIAVASKIMGKAIAKLDREDPELAKLLSDAIAAEVERLRR